MDRNQQNTSRHGGKSSVFRKAREVANGGNQMRVDLVTNNLYRGSRPESVNDLLVLKSIGINTIISLETGWHKLFGWRGERKAWQHFGNPWLNVPLSDIFPPSLDECESICEIISMSKFAPFFVHCFSGVDRTGFVIAYYRVTRMGWCPFKAWKEAVDKGMHWRYYWWRRHFLKICRRRKQFFPAVRLVITVEGQLMGGDMDLQIQQGPVNLICTGVDFAGNPAPLAAGDAPVWSVDAVALGAITAVANGLTAALQETGKLGIINITAVGQEAAGPISGSLQLNLLAGPASGLQISLA